MTEENAKQPSDKDNLVSPSATTENKQAEEHTSLRPSPTPISNLVGEGVIVDNKVLPEPLGYLAFTATNWPYPQPAIAANLYVEVNEKFELVSLNGANFPNILDLDWSPDGQQLVIAGTVNSPGRSNLYLVRLEGGIDVELLVELDADILNATWSPDGQKIAFEVWPGEIYTVDLEQRDVIHLSIGMQPDWSSQDIIAFVKAEKDENENISTNIYTIAPDGSGLRQLIKPRYNVSQPQWSFDGQEIAYQVMDSNKVYSSISVADSNGKNVKQVRLKEQSVDEIMFFSWVPHENSLLLANMKDGNLYTYNLATQTVMLVGRPYSPRGYYYAKVRP
ncbi:MAG: PD40 domain-containing protein [Anaerolineales bacterium]|nr:PD40 domain-containing protein [Anaerolineales bacterium]